MNINALPEEILLHILSFRLLLHPSVFCDRYRYWYPRSRSRYYFPPKDLRTAPLNTLIVCKKWHRVGIPLLYSSVNIVAFERKLDGLIHYFRKHPEVGKSVISLRLKLFDHPCTQLPELMCHMPNIRAIYIGDASFDVAQYLSTTIQPTSLYAYIRPHIAWHKGFPDRYRCFESLIRDKWLSLTSIHLFEVRADLPHSTIEALASAPSLKEISMDVVDLLTWISPRALERIAENPRLEKITCRRSALLGDRHALYNRYSPEVSSLLSFWYEGDCLDPGCVFNAKHMGLPIYSGASD